MKSYLKIKNLEKKVNLILSFTVKELRLIINSIKLKSEDKHKLAMSRPPVVVLTHV